MRTRRFANLSPVEQADVISAFLGSESKIDFTEKLAGQHLSVTIHTDKTVTYRGKNGGKQPGGLFPQVNKILKVYHPQVSSDTLYEFEVLKKIGRSDFIDYPITKDFTVVELSGAMSSDIAQSINRKQDTVHFLTRESIKQRAGDYVKDPDDKKTLSIILDKLKLGKKLSKVEITAAEQLLMMLVDSGHVPSALGSERIEGLFGNTEGGTFKIPSKAFNELQQDQAKFVGIARRMSLKNIEDRFIAAIGNPSADRLVSDVIKYVEKMSSVKLPKGFKTFFSTTEIIRLNTLIASYMSGTTASATELAYTFFRRVSAKGDWARTGIQEASVVSDLRKLIRAHVSTMIINYKAL